VPRSPYERRAGKPTLTEARVWDKEARRGLSGHHTLAKARGVCREVRMSDERAGFLSASERRARSESSKISSLGKSKRDFEVHTPSLFELKPALLEELHASFNGLGIIEDALILDDLSEGFFDPLGGTVRTVRGHSLDDIGNAQDPGFF
jgi:hypothetical protein